MRHHPLHLVQVIVEPLGSEQEEQDCAEGDKGEAQGTRAPDEQKINCVDAERPEKYEKGKGVRKGLSNLLLTLVVL